MYESCSEWETTTRKRPNRYGPGRLDYYASVCVSRLVPKRVRCLTRNEAKTTIYKNSILLIIPQLPICPIPTNFWARAAVCTIIRRRRYAGQALFGPPARVADPSTVFESRVPRIVHFLFKMFRTSHCCINNNFIIVLQHVFWPQKIILPHDMSKSIEVFSHIFDVITEPHLKKKTVIFLKFFFFHRLHIFLFCCTPKENVLSTVRYTNINFLISGYWLISYT